MHAVMAPGWQIMQQASRSPPVTRVDNPDWLESSIQRKAEVCTGGRGDNLRGLFLGEGGDLALLRNEGEFWCKVPFCCLLVGSAWLTGVIKTPVTRVCDRLPGWSVFLF